MSTINLSTSQGAPLHPYKDGSNIYIEESSQSPDFVKTIRASLERLEISTVKEKSGGGTTNLIEKLGAFSTRKIVIRFSDINEAVSNNSEQIVFATGKDDVDVVAEKDGGPISFPQFVVLGHELIHILHDLREECVDCASKGCAKYGTRGHISNRLRGTYYRAVDLLPKMEFIHNNVEEHHAIHNENPKKPNHNGLSENFIRRQNGLPCRYGHLTYNHLNLNLKALAISEFLQQGKTEQASAWIARYMKDVNNRALLVLCATNEKNDPNFITSEFKKYGLADQKTNTTAQQCLSPRMARAL